MNKKIVIVLVIFLIGIAYYLLSPLFIVKEVYDDLPSEENLEYILSAKLVPSAHDVSGKIAVYDIDGKRTLRFEDFDTVNGPDLFIYLATDITASDFISLGEIKATKGNVNYEIPVGTDLNKYDTVLVWCKAFKVLFSYGELK
mgnify:CR=1 FL=1